MKLPVIHRGADKQHPTRSHNRPAVVLCTGVLYAQFDQVRILAEWNFPQVVPRLEVNCIECSPRRRNRRITVWIEEFSIASESVSILARRLSLRKFARVDAQITQQSLQLRTFNLGHRRHSPF